jgi:DDE superfamily endonuclease
LGQLTSDAVKLIVPDKQLARISHPHIMIPRLRGKLFFFDEAKVSWCPQSGLVYRVVGQEYKVNTPGVNKTWYILGSLGYPDGDGLYEIYEHQTNVQVRLHWQHLLDMCPDEFVFVVRDNRQHVTPILDDFLLEHQDRFCLVPLPTYSPNLNLIERLWDYMRDNITRSTFYITLEKLCETLVNWLKELPFERFWSLLGLSP